MMVWFALVGIWLIGAVASNAAQRIMGESNPNTIGDYFSGDDFLDLVCIVAWPIFWPCWAVHKITTKAVLSLKKDDDAVFVETDTLKLFANWFDPEIGFPNDDLLRRINADIEIRGRKNPDFAVTVHHRNIVLSAVANALRNSHLLTWDEWIEHCGWPKEEAIQID